MFRRNARSFRVALATAALAFAGAVAAWAASPGQDGWVADPDEQFLLDVNIRQLRLGDGVRAYDAPGGLCVILGDFLTTLDVPMKIDVGTRKASGWAFREENRIEIDRVAATVRYGAKQEALEPQAIRETPEGWCVEAGALGRWFGIGVKPSTGGSLLLLESEAKLPVELAIEREKRAAQLKKKAALPLAADLPTVRLPYRMWRAPAMDFIVSAGATYQAKNGMRVDRRASVQLAGELAKLSYDALISTDNKGKPQSIRFRGYRSDPDGGLLGPLGATHFAFGDVQGVDSRLSPMTSGRGAEITNRPLFNPVAFDRTRFEGDLPPGWEAELYRNGELLSFARGDGTNRYIFNDVPLTYGDNRFEILLYGPQGQTKSRIETLNVGEEQVPAGQAWYSASISQPGRAILGKLTQESGDVFAGGKRPDGNFRNPDLNATARLDYGISNRTSIGVLATTLLADDQRLTFVEGSVRQSFGSVIAEAGVARDQTGGTAVRAQALGRFGAVDFSLDALAGNDFVINGQREARYRDVRAAVNAPLKLGRTPLALHGDVHYMDRTTGGRQLQVNGRVSGNINGFNLSALARWQRRFGATGSGSGNDLDNFDLALMGTGRIKKVRVRAQAEWQVVPESRFRRAELSAYWSASDHADWEGALGYDAFNKHGTARISHIRRFNAFSAAASLEAGTDGRVAAGLNLNFSLDSGAKGLRLTNQRLASAGSVEARVFHDLNDNGQLDRDEPFEVGATITTGNRVTDATTGKDGRVRVDGLAPNRPIAVGIDASTLSDPMLAPRKALQQIIPRAGVAASVDIALVGAGAIEGIMTKADGSGFEGLDVELVDEQGKVIASTQSDYDGFILFDRVPYGHYRLRLTAETAKAVGAPTDLATSVQINAEKSVQRLGGIRVSRTSTSIALATPADKDH